MTADGGGWTLIPNEEINYTLIGDGRQYVKPTDLLGVFGVGQGVHIIAMYYGDDIGINLLANIPKPTTMTSYALANGDGYNYFGGRDFFTNNGLDNVRLTLTNGVAVFNTGLVGVIRVASNGASTIPTEPSYIYYSSYDFELYERL